MKKPQAIKHDIGKTRYDLLPPEALEAVARVLTFGAKKYGDRNWEKGLDYDRIFAAAQRHMWAHHGGEKLDPESGLSHLAHAACNLAFLLHAEAVDKNIETARIGSGFVMDMEGRQSTEPPTKRAGEGFHAGCLGCESLYLKDCVGCACFERDWTLPSKNTSTIKEIARVATIYKLAREEAAQ